MVLLAWRSRASHHRAHLSKDAHLLTLVVFAIVSPHVAAQYLREPLPVLDTPPSYATEDVSQTTRFQTLFDDGDERLIEPTSPVLGRALVSNIRQDPRHPDEILRAIDEEFPLWRRELSISVHAYARALAPALEAHVVSVGETRPEPSSSTPSLVEHAAIPLEILTPHHARYVESMRVLVEQARWIDADVPTLLAAAQRTTSDLRARRRALADEGPLFRAAELVGEHCPSACGELVRANLRIAAAEDSFPRVQYAVNGFTGFVFHELMRRTDLHALLRVVYDAEKDWLDRAETGERPARALVESVVDAARIHGHVPRDVILVLAFSTRNMPSVDFQYADDPERALALEVYFWKFRQMRDVIVRRHLPNLTEAHVFDVNPGVYHFTTAGLHGCELGALGFPDVVSVTSTTAFKVAYKSHKLVHGFDVGALFWSPISYIPTRMREQGYATGVEAGFYGGMLGVEMCRESEAR